MFEKVLLWPEQIDSSTWSSIDPSDLYPSEKLGYVPQLANFVNILKFIKDGLTAVQDPRHYQAWSFTLSNEQLIDVWCDMLRRLKETATLNPDWLQNAMWNFNGTQVSPWMANFDAAHGGFSIINDPYVLNDQIKQYDFGTLFEIGRDLHRFNILVKGGVNSVLTKTALDKIEQKSNSSISDIDQKKSAVISELEAQLSTATTDKISQIKTVEASKDWSVHYDSRCHELETIINGSKNKAGLDVIRKKWFRILLFTFFCYAIVALLIAHGWWVFALDSHLNTSLQGFSRYFIGLTLYGILVGVYIGYAYAGKQLKIHQNLLEQYRHRSIVAKTIESVVYSVIKSKENPDNPESTLREKDLELLVQVAATSMFEYRPIGHLSTREGTSVLGEIFNTKG